MVMAVATKGPIGSPEIRTYVAGVANIKRGLALTLGADENHAVIAGANAVCIGIAAEDAPSGAVGDAVAAAVAGETIAQIGAAVTAGQFLKSDATGKLVPAAAAGDNIIAQAVSGNPNSGDFICARLARAIAGAVAAVVNAVASAAIAIQSGTVTLGSGGALAMTLATPATPGDDGKRIWIVAATAQAHTVTTAANKIKNANASGDTLTFAHIGDSVELEAVGGLWYVKSINGPVLTEV